MLGAAIAGLVWRYVNLHFSFSFSFFEKGGGGRVLEVEDDLCF